VHELIQNVQRVAQELDEIQQGLQHAEAATPSIPLDLELLNNFKASVDHMRHVLWAYIEAMSSNGDVDRTLQQYRMQRATEMLRQLREAGPLSAENPHASSFLREIQAIADGALQRHVKAED